MKQCRRKCHHVCVSKEVNLYCDSYADKPLECTCFYPAQKKLKSTHFMRNYYKNCETHGDKW